MYILYSSKVIYNYLLSKKQTKAKFDGIMDIKKIQKEIESNVPEIMDLYKLINRSLC